MKSTEAVVTDVTANSVPDCTSSRVRRQKASSNFPADGLGAFVSTEVARNVLPAAGWILATQRPVSSRMKKLGWIALLKCAAMYQRPW